MPTPRDFTEIGGSVQCLPNGHTLVSFGTAGRVVEYDGANVLWRRRVHLSRAADSLNVFTRRRCHSMTTRALVARLRICK